MFESIELKGLKTSKSFGYAAEVPYFKGKKKVAFKPGLNVLLGPNGCGKSTVLKILGQTMSATQGGLSAITEGAARDVLMASNRLRGNEAKSLVGLKVRHDGQPVLFCDPRQAIGLVSGAFDDDFFEQGVGEAMSGGKRSHGQASLGRMEAVLGVLLGKLQFPPEVIHKAQKKNYNDSYGAAIDVLLADMEPSIPKGQQTILLDEPEANFSLVWQSRLWARLASPAVSEKFQIIVASHSAYSLNIPHANYVEFEPGFREEAEAGLLARFGTV